MKKLLLLFALFAAIRLNAQNEISLTPYITLQMPSGDGKNAASVVYHPIEKQYHTCFAGDASFTYCIFDEDGNLVSSKKAGADIRGLWVIGKEIMYNVYKGENQPGYNSVGTYSSKKNSILFFHNYMVFYYKPKELTGVASPLKISEKTGYNKTSIGYISKNNMELIILNVEKRQLEFYSEKTKELSAFIEIPKRTKLEHELNFSVTNNTAFFFDTSDRTWYGMKIEL